MTLEREANELLAKGDRAGAQAKFAAADRLSTGGAPATAAPAGSSGIALTAPTDPAVHQIAAGDPGPSPDLTAPVDQPAAQPTLSPTEPSAAATPELPPAPAQAPDPVNAGAPAAAAPAEPRSGIARRSQEAVCQW